MSHYCAFRAALCSALRGASDTGGPCLRPLPLIFDRPEGPRRCLIAAPDGTQQQRRALVIVLHGQGASAEQIMGLAFSPSPLSHLLEIGARENLVVAAPDAGKGGWSDCRASAATVSRKDDVALIGAVIDHALANLNVDPRRVYLIGVSRGGLMAYRAAAEIPQRLAAFAAVLACMPAANRMRAPSTALPALLFGATADPFMLYHGGRRWYTLGQLGPLRSIDDSVKLWRELAGLPDTPQVMRIAAGQRPNRTHVTRSLWGADDGMQVGLYRIEHGGHAEPSCLKRYPGVLNRLVGPQNHDIEVAQAAWDFFRAKRSAAASAPP